MEAHTYSRVAVLLDGTQTSEVILQFVPSLVRSAGFEHIVLLRVVEDPSARGRTTVEAYLRERAERLRHEWPAALGEAPDIAADAAPVRGGDAARTAGAYVAEKKVDAVMLSTLGWSGPDWWSAGSADERVIKESRVPVFVSRIAGGRHPRPGIVRRVLVTLDGSAVAEEALPFAGRLAESAGASLHLLHVVEDGGRQSHPHGASPFAGGAGQDAEGYLKAVAARLHARGAAVSTSVRRGRPGPQIAEAAQADGADLVIMCSHGHTGRGGGAFGGVADRVLHACHVPVLVVPASHHDG